MRILLIVDCYYPSATAAAKLIRDLGIEFHKQGHVVTVFTPSECATADLELSREDGLLVARIRTGRIKGVAKVVRAFREARLSSVIWRKGRRFFQQEPHDLILFYSPSIFFGPLVRKLKSLWGCTAYLILRDIFPQWAVDTGVMRKGLPYLFFRLKENQQYAAADVIGVQSPANLEYFRQHFSKRHFNLDVLYNWASLADTNSNLSGYRKDLELEGKIVFVYGGNIGVAQDMDNLIRLACNLKREPQIHLLLVGEGSEVARLRQVIIEQQLTNISMLPAVGPEEYLAILRASDVGLISLDRRLQTQNFPGKLLSYMHCGLPILASINPDNDLKTMLDDCQAGMCSINGEDETFCGNALVLAGNPELRQRMGRNARQLLEERFSVASSTKQILVKSELARRKPFAGRQSRERGAEPQIAIGRSTQTAP